MTRWAASLLFAIGFAAAGGASAQVPCVQDAETLCFLGSRIAVTVEWTDTAASETRPARAVPLAGDTGAFWFFQESNLEVIVKVLDGTGINDSFWVFIASLSDVGFTVTATDRATGSTQRYENPPGNRWGVVDIDAFRQNVLSEGETCGGLVPPGTPFACADGLFCDDPSGNCQLEVDGTGVCTTRPEICTDQFDPVCGCDGRTYGNDCERQRAGVSRRNDGECRPGVAICGGIAGFACDTGQICAFPENMCQVADLAGVCVPKPEACPAVFDPVCGCNGVTYSNQCELVRAGATKASDGACQKQ